MDGRGEPGSDAAARWADARVVAALFAVDPSGLGGVALRGGPGPAREAWLATLARALGSDAPTRRMPAGMDDERLIGGVDLVATLAAGRTVASKGLLAEADGGVVIIPMAERLPAPVAALIGGALDRHEIIIERDGVTARAATRFGIVALDESVGDEERVPAFLMARLAFHIDLAPFAGRGWTIGGAAAEDIAMAREAWRRMEPAPDEIIEALVGTAAAFGIGEVTAPLLALRAARAAAALSGRAGIVAEDAALAARLVLAPRALSLP